MARQRRPPYGPLRGLMIWLLVVQLQVFMVLSTPTPAQHATSSILDDANRTVPDYITRYGMTPPSAIHREH